MGVPQLPSEVWKYIFFSIHSIHDKFDPSSDAWARIASDSKHWEALSHVPVEYSETKRALGLVSRGFYHISRPFVLEIITLRRIDSLRHLASRLDQDPELARLVKRCTKRVHVQIDARNKRNSTFRPQQIFTDVENVLKSCTTLVHFSCCIDENGMLRSGGDLLLHVFTNWRLPPSIKWYMPSVVPNIRVLELFAGMLEERQSINEESHSLPHLHTLIGPLAAIGFQLQHFELPSLRTLICRPGGDYFWSDVEIFLQHHGKKIESLDVGQGIGVCLSRMLPNVVELIMSSEDVIPFYESWPNVRNLGIFSNAYVSRGACNGFVVRNTLDVLLLVLTARENGDWEALRTIRVFNDVVEHILDRDRILMQLREAKLRTCSIALENKYGEPLLSSSE